MSRYVSDWSPEVYGDVRDYAVSGASAAERRDHLNDYLGHQLALAEAAPPEAAAARDYIRQTFSPLANAAWIWESGYGYTNVPLAQMQDYVTAQTYALRSFDAAHGLSVDHFGFAWAPKMLDNSAWTSDYASQTGLLLDRIAASIRESDQSPEAACGTAWCTSTVDGAAFVDTWKTFATWSYPTVGFTSAAATITAGTSAPISVQLQTNGVVQAAAAPVTVTLTSRSAAGTFSTGADGPWTPSLDVVIPAGSSDATAYYRDTAAGTPTITAATAGRQPGTQQETVTAADPASIQLAPASATLAIGGTQAFTLTGADAYGNPVTPTAAWSLSTGTPGTLSATTATTATFTGSAAGTGSVVATSGTLTASAAVSVTAPRLRVSSITYTRSSTGRLTITVKTVDPSGRGVSGVSVALRVTRGSNLLASGTWTTGTGGKLTLTTSSRASGCYRTAVTGLTASGYAWDGVTPSNGACF
jgi:hypothetical protein